MDNVTKNYGINRECIVYNFRSSVQKAKNILDRSDPKNSKDLIDLVRLGEKLILYTSEPYLEVLCHGKNGLIVETREIVRQLSDIVSAEINLRINYTNDYRQKLEEKFEEFRSDVIIGLTF